MAKQSLYDNINSVNSQYVPRFVGSNYNELSEAKKALDERFYRNRDYSDKISMMLAQEQYLEGDRAIKDKLTESIYGQIDAISKSESNFENSSAAVSQLAREFLTNQERIAALDNYRRVEEARELQTKLGAQAINFGDSLEKFSTIDPNTGQTRRFNLGIEQRLDYDKQREQFYNQIEADLKAGKLSPVDIEGIYGFVSSSMTETNVDKIGKYLNDAFLRYKSTPEYQQERRKLTQLEGLSSDQADQTIKDNLAAVGRERLLNRTRIQYEQDPFAIYAAKKSLEEEQGAVLDRANSQYLRNPNLPDNPFEGVEFKEDGTATASRIKDIKYQMTPRGPVPILTPEPDTNKTEEVNNAAATIVDNNQRSLPFLEQQYGSGFASQYNLSGMNPKQIGELHTKAYDSMKSISANILRPSGDVLDALNKVIVPSIQDRSIYTLDKQGKPTQGGDYAAVREDLDMSAEEFAKAIENAKVTGIAPFNPYNTELAGGFTMTITTPDGHRTLLVGADQGQAAFFKRGQMLSMAKMTGQRVDIPPGSGLDEFGYVATPLLNKNGTYDVYVSKYDRNTNMVPFDPDGKVFSIPLDDLLEMDVSRYTNSNLLRSKLTRTKNTSVE